MQLRTRALERRKLPDELDQLSGLARPLTMLGVGALTVAVVVLVVWSFVGTIPRTVNAPGLLVEPGGLAEVGSAVSGSVQSVPVADNEFVGPGQPVAVIGGTTVRAPFAGRIIGLQIIVGQVVSVGQPLYTLERTISSLNHSAVYLFIPVSKGVGVAPGMSVNITVSSAPSAAFGVLRGKVASVGTSPLSTAGVAALVANPDLAAQFTQGGPPLLAQVTLTPDAKTASGYTWSTPKGAPFPLQPGTQVTAQITESQQRPINVIFGT